MRRCQSVPHCNRLYPVKRHFTTPNSDPCLHCSSPNRTTGDARPDRSSEPRGLASSKFWVRRYPSRAAPPRGPIAKMRAGLGRSYVDQAAGATRSAARTVVQPSLNGLEERPPRQRVARRPPRQRVARRRSGDPRRAGASSGGASRTTRHPRSFMPQSPRPRCPQIKARRGRVGLEALAQYGLIRFA